MKRGMVRYGQFLFKYRNTIFPLVLIVLLACLPPRLPFGSIGLDIGLDTLGILVIISGLALRGLVIGLQYIKRGGQNRQVYANELVTGGIFAASRNPLYVGNFLVILGLLIIAGNIWIFIAGVILSLSAYLAIVAAEEEFLLHKFGAEYHAYCASVNRWLPSPTRVVEALNETDFNWPRVIIKDYNTVYIWLTAALAMLVYEHVAIAAYHQDWSDQQPLGLAFLGLTIAYLVARALKKKRLLTPKGWRA
jgi:protein-S-isoprenylcysteine O-methyltransferase Ste14